PHPPRVPLTRGSVREGGHAPGLVRVAVEMGVAVREPSAPGEPVPYTWLPAGSRDSGQGWRTARAALAPLAGRTAYGLAVRITAPGTKPVVWRIGALSVHDGPRSRRPAPPTAAVVDASARQDGRAWLRLSWRAAAGPGGRPRHYEVWRILPDGGRRFLGGTCGTALYLPAVPRAGRERAAAFEVRAVDELYAASAPARVSLTW
ncbi:endo-beta-N-acetylglucosaminidase, partial [Streptomyces sp. NPDC059558]